MFTVEYRFLDGGDAGPPGEAVRLGPAGEAGRAAGGLAGGEADGQQERAGRAACSAQWTTSTILLYCTSTGEEVAAHLLRIR